CLALRGIPVGEVFTLRGDMVSHMLGVVPNAPDERGATTRLPRQAQEIHARLARNAPLMLRLTVGVEGVDLQPAVINGKTGCPDDRCHASLGQVELKNGLGHTLRIREGM